MPYSAIQIQQYAMRAGYIFISLSTDCISLFERFDFSMHKDPFDQMLVCQSAAHEMRLLTHDAKLKEYGVGFIELF